MGDPTAASGFDVDEKLLPFAIEEFGDQCWGYGSDIPHGHRLYGAVDMFLKRNDISEESTRKLLGRGWKCDCPAFEKVRCCQGNSIEKPKRLLKDPVYICSAEARRGTAKIGELRNRLRLARKQCDFGLS